MQTDGALIDQNPQNKKEGSMCKKSALLMLVMLVALVFAVGGGVQAGNSLGCNQNTSHIRNSDTFIKAAFPAVSEKPVLIHLNSRAEAPANPTPHEKRKVCPIQSAWRSPVQIPPRSACHPRKSCRRQHQGQQRCRAADGGEIAATFYILAGD